METFVFVVSGGYGDGKTAMGVSYSRPGVKPKRIVIDKELRAIRYQSKEHKAVGDHPEKLLFEFDVYPDQYGEVGIDEFLKLLEELKEKKYNVLIVDNIAMLQNDIEGMCQTAPNARKILKALDADARHENTLKYNFKVGTPQWWNVVKDIEKGLLLVAKKADMDIIITTELSNKWENFGVRGTAPDGKPFQRILGQTAKIWNFAVQLADVMWVLKRVKDKVNQKPTVSIDTFNPKNSIVGSPPTFQWEDWPSYWKLVENRGLPTSEDYAEVEMPEVEYREGDPDGTDDGVDPLEAGKLKLMNDLEDYGYKDRSSVGAAMTKLGIKEYTLADHDQIFAALVEYKEKKEE